MNLHGNVVPRNVSTRMGLELSVGWLLLAVSGSLFQLFLRFASVRYQEKRTFRIRP